MSIGAALLYLVVLVAVSFVVSGAVPRYREVVARRKRVEEFERKYTEWAKADGVFPNPDDFMSDGIPDDWAAATEEAALVIERVRPWLVARRDQMQRDAQVMNRGIMYVAPPPIIGGSYQPHGYFSDLFDTQTNSVGSSSFRLDELASIGHETGEQEARRKRDLYNPWAWVRLAFERVIGFPRYVLRHAGFSPNVTDSTAARLVSVLWSVLVGLAGIGGFVMSLLREGR